MTDQEARQEAYARYDGDREISDLTGEEETFDDWGYAESERRAFLAGVEWQKTREHQEPEWEYAHSANGYWNDDETEFTAEGYYDVGDDARGAIARRTKAGPWEPVE